MPWSSIQPGDRCKSIANLDEILMKSYPFSVCEDICLCKTTVLMRKEEDVESEQVTRLDA